MIFGDGCSLLILVMLCIMHPLYVLFNRLLWSWSECFAFPSIRCEPRMVGCVRLQNLIRQRRSCARHFAAVFAGWRAKRAMTGIWACFRQRASCIRLVSRAWMLIFRLAVPGKSELGLGRGWLSIGGALYGHFCAMDGLYLRIMRLHLAFIVFYIRCMCDGQLYMQFRPTLLGMELSSRMMQWVCV